MAKRIAFTLTTFALAIAVVEAIVWIAWRPSLDALPEVAVPEEDPDLKTGREQAGLGFQDPTMSLHPYLGYVFLPKEERPPGAPGHPAISISDDGFLDPASMIRTRSDDRLIVGVMGGSVSGQLGSFHHEHLASALRRHPEFRDKEPDFVWLGMPGYHQPQQLLQLCWVLAHGGDFDFLVNLDGFNELAVPAALNAPQGAHPLYPMNWSMVALDVPDPELQRHVGAVAHLTEERRERIARFRASPWSRSPTATLLRQLDDRKLASRIADHAWFVQEFPVEEIPYFVRGPERAHVADEELILECVDVWTRCSLQMHAICAANGIRYLHCLQPNQYDPGSKPLSAAERETAFDVEGPYRPIIEDGYARLREAGEQLRAAGVEFHDLSQVFAGEKSTLYVDSCCHFNGEGNRILAEAIGEAMASSF
jgi:hypothetical protein